MFDNQTEKGPRVTVWIAGTALRAKVPFETSYDDGEAANKLDVRGEGAKFLRRK